MVNVSRLRYRRAKAASHPKQNVGAVETASDAFSCTKAVLYGQDQGVTERLERVASIWQTAGFNVQTNEDINQLW